MIRSVLGTVLLAVLAGCAVPPADVQEPDVAGPTELLVTLRNDGDSEVRYQVSVQGPTGGLGDGGTLAPGGTWRHAMDMRQDGTYEVSWRVETVTGNARVDGTWDVERGDCDVERVEVGVVAEPGHVLLENRLGGRLATNCV